MSVTRRQLLQSATAALAFAAVRPGFALEDASTSASKEAVQIPLSQFDYAQVELLPGRMRQQFDNNHRLYLSLDNNALLKPFRHRVGQPDPGEFLGGWYDDSDDFEIGKTFHGYVPGHTFGQFMSGLSRAYAATGDHATQAKVHTLVRMYAETLNGSRSFFDGYRLPAYTFDKVVVGLIDAHQYAGDPVAVQALSKTVDSALPFLPERALTREEMRARPHREEANTWDEPYTLPENLFLAYERSGNPRYRELAVRYLQDEKYFDPLAEGKNVLPGEHAYSHVNAFNSAFQAYRFTGNPKYLRAATNGLRMVEETQSFATGGWGPDESFRVPGSGDYGESLAKSHASFETPCGAYAHFKITRSLLRLTRDPQYGDSMERVLYNTILGALPTEPDGRTFYYSDYNEKAKKGFHQDRWPCCAGTFPQVTADYLISAYFAAPDGVYVNLFVPSRLRCKVAGANCVLEQNTEYPLTPQTSLVFKMDRAARFATYVRIPKWSGPRTRVAVNGRSVGQVQPGPFNKIDREWRSGDRIEIEFDMQTRLQPVDDKHPNLVAATSGPLALMALGDSFPKLTRHQLQAIRKASSNEWQVKTDSDPIRFRPFFEINDETYRLYQSVEG